MHQTLFQTRMLSQTSRSNDIDFIKYKETIENEIKQNSLGFKYLKQLEQRKTVIINKIQEYQSKLKTSNGDLIIFCDFTFNEQLDLLIKAADVKQQFLDQQSPNENIGVKINQQDLLSALTSIIEFMSNECNTCKNQLLINQDSNGDIWNQTEWYLQNNNQKESEKYLLQVEKHRKNMINKLIDRQVNLDQCIEFSFYLEHYYQFFDRFNVSQRNQIYRQFLQYLQNLSVKDDQLYNLNKWYQNNMITTEEQQKFLVNSSFSSQFSLSIPKFLMSDIQKLNLQGYILLKMIEHKVVNLNYQAIDHIFLKNQRENVLIFPRHFAGMQMQI